MVFKWHAAQREVEWGAQFATTNPAAPGSLGRFPAIHAYLCPYDGYPLLIMWKLSARKEPVPPATIKDDLKDEGYDQYRVFTLPNAGQGCEYTPIGDSRQTEPRHIHERLSKEYGSDYYSTYGEWYPLVYMNPITALNVVIEYSADRLELSNPKKVAPLPFFNVAKETHWPQILKVLKAKDNSRYFSLVEDEARRGRPIMFFNKGTKYGIGPRHGGVDLELLKSLMPFLDWHMLPEVPAEKTETNPTENPTRKQLLYWIVRSLERWKVPGEIRDYMDLEAWVDPQLTYPENLGLLLERVPGLRHYAEAGSRGPSGRQLTWEAARVDSDYIDSVTSDVLDRIATKMAQRLPGTGDVVDKALDYLRPDVDRIIRRQRARQAVRVNPRAAENIEAEALYNLAESAQNLMRRPRVSEDRLNMARGLLAALTADERSSFYSRYPHAWKYSEGKSTDVKGGHAEMVMHEYERSQAGRLMGRTTLGQFAAPAANPKGPCQAPYKGAPVRKKHKWTYRRDGTGYCLYCGTPAKPLKRNRNPHKRWVRTPSGQTVGWVVEVQGGAGRGPKRHLLETATGQRVWVHGRVYDTSMPIHTICERGDEREHIVCADLCEWRCPRCKWVCRRESVPPESDVDLLARQQAFEDFVDAEYEMRKAEAIDDWQREQRERGEPEANPPVVLSGPHAASPHPVGWGHPSDTIVAELTALTAHELNKRGVDTRAILAGAPRTKRDMNRKEGRSSQFRRRVNREVQGV